MSDIASPLQFDVAAANAIICGGINQAHLLEMEHRFEGIGQYFAQEQEEGYPTLETNLRAWTQSHLRTKDISDTIALSESIRQRFKVFVLVGIGGSDLGGRTLIDSIDHPYHNQLSIEDRKGAPEIYFTGDTFDPKRLLALLELLTKRELMQDTCFNIVSKSGKTGETISAAMVLREKLVELGVANWASQIVATTGQNSESVLFEMNKITPFFGMLPVPDGVGGRFSYASPVGLLPFAVTAVDETPRERIEAAMAGFTEAHRRFLLEPTDSDNTAYQLARWWQLGEQFNRRSDMVFCNYADDSRLGGWFMQLYEESIQERGSGLNIIATQGPTGNHSILNGILRGPHDKLVLIVRWNDLGHDTTIPTGTGIGGDLKFFEGLPLSAVQDASCRATYADYLGNGVPTAMLTVSKRDTYHLFLFMRTLMDAVAIKGKLQWLDIGENGLPDPATELTYRQDGVEGYKIKARKNAEEMQKAL